MSQSVLSEAIALIKAGKKTEAQQLLEPLLESDPHHIIAWLWYAETWTTAPQKIRALELGLQHNPDSEKIKTAVLRLQTRHRPKEKPATRNAWIIASVIGLAILGICCSGPTLLSIFSPQAGTTAPSDSTTAIQEFESSEFCRKYQCRRYATSDYKGETAYYHNTILSDGATEITVYVSKQGKVKYSLGLQPVSASGLLDESKVEWEDPQAVFDLFKSVAPDVEVTDEIKSQVRRNLMQHLEQICYATPISLGKYQAWIGRVSFYEQTAIIDTECQKP